MKVITKYGDSFYADAELGYKDNGYIPTVDTAVVVQDGVRLEKKWVVDICERKFAARPSDVPEVVAEYRFDHEPTEEEIMYAYVSSGLGPYNGYASVDQIWEFKEDEEE